MEEGKRARRRRGKGGGGRAEKKGELELHHGQFVCRIIPLVNNYQGVIGYLSS